MANDDKQIIFFAILLDGVDLLQHGLEFSTSIHRRGLVSPADTLATDKHSGNLK